MSATLPLPHSTARFNRQAAAYNHYAAIQRDMATWLAQWLPAQKAANARQGANFARDLRGSPLRTLNPADNGLHALDLGAGSGAFTRHLAERYPRVSALDSAPQMLRQGQHALPQAQWLQGDAWTLEPLAQSIRNVNLITSASLLQWCDSPQQTLQNWARRCAPGTHMLHGFYVEPTLHEWRTLFGNTGQLHWRSAAEWLGLFAEAGWRVLRSECETRNYCFTNALELARSLHRTGAIANAGQLASGRFRTLLRAYDKTYQTAAHRSANPLYAFAKPTGVTRPNLPAQSDSPASEDAPTHTPAAAPAGGVFATWAFFRVEAVLG